MALDTKLAVKRARDLIAKLGINEPPVPMQEIASILGIRTQYVALDDELSGMAYVRDDIKNIIINAGHHPNRQRFTFAHEIAHHVLHADYLSDSVHVDKVVMKRDKSSRFGTDEREVQANAFAAELLMPVKMIKPYKDVDVNNEKAVTRLSQIFKVSVAAISFRLINIAS